MTFIDTIITPSRLIFSAGPNVTVNGSSAIGNCVNKSRRTTCYSDDPNSTVLFDNPIGLIKRNTHTHWTRW